MLVFIYGLWSQPSPCYPGCPPQHTHTLGALVTMIHVASHELIPSHMAYPCHPVQAQSCPPWPTQQRPGSTKGSLGQGARVGWCACLARLGRQGLGLPPCGRGDWCLPCLSCRGHSLTHTRRGCCTSAVLCLLEAEQKLEFQAALRRGWEHLGQDTEAP